MNTQKLTQYLTTFKKWFKANKVQAAAAQKERENIAAHIQSFTKEKLLNMSEEELFNYIAPLWAMAMWGNKHYQVDNIIEANGMKLLQEQFANLIYGNSSIEKRWDEFRSKIKGVGPAIMSELLCKTYPNEFLIWNTKTYNGFRLLQVPELPRYEARLNGKLMHIYLLKVETWLPLLKKMSMWRSLTCLPSTHLYGKNYRLTMI